MDRRSSRPDLINEHKQNAHATIDVGARSSFLSIAQVVEVFHAIKVFHPNLTFNPHFIQTSGDADRTTPLWEVASDDFFTRELDQLLILGTVRITIHSAKDMPKTLHQSLSCIAVTKGVDQRDSLVMRAGDTISSLPPSARIGTSSMRRISMLSKLRPDFIPVSIRGTIHDRLQLLFKGKVDAIIVAQAALIRLNLTFLNYKLLPFAPDPLQGQISIVGRNNDKEMEEIFQKIDTGQRQ